jgi:ATP-binding protein involved in chromosome partitioning
VVEKRLSGIAIVAAFCSAKGGVGKTMCTTVTASALAQRGLRVGVLDLDLQGASAHVFLGVAPGAPKEERGILPLTVAENLRLMSVASFTGNLPLPLRGPQVTDAILELLAVTRWGEMDYLLIDMPPGIGEEMLDIARLIPRTLAIVISTPAAASVSVVERLLALLSEMRVAVPGVIANMVREDAEPVRRIARQHGAAFAGEVPFEPALESCMGNPSRLAASGAAAALLGSLSSMGLPVRPAAT